MQFSVGVEYAFHSLFYMMDLPSGDVIGIKELSSLHNVSETYLSKIFTKLKKYGIVRSVPGVKGGYELLRKPSDISFWDVIEAIEGPSYLFQCAELRQKNILFKDDMSNEDIKYPCLIKTVLIEAEDQMRNYLRGKSLQWLKDDVSKGFSEEKKEKITDWFERIKK